MKTSEGQQAGGSTAPGSKAAVAVTVKQELKRADPFQQSPAKRPHQQSQQLSLDIFYSKASPVGKGNAAEAPGAGAVLTCTSAGAAAAAANTQHQHSTIPTPVQLADSCKCPSAAAAAADGQDNIHNTAAQWAAAGTGGSGGRSAGRSSSGSKHSARAHSSASAEATAAKLLRQRPCKLESGAGSLHSPASTLPATQADAAAHADDSAAGADVFGCGNPAAALSDKQFAAEHKLGSQQQQQEPPSQQQQQQQQPLWQQQDLPAWQYDFSGTGAAGPGLQAASLNDQFMAWPDIGDCTTDLMPAMTSSPGTEQYMQLLIAQTQPPEPAAGKAGGRGGGRAGRGGRGRGAAAGSGRGRGRGRPRGKGRGADADADTWSLQDGSATTVDSADDYDVEQQQQQQLGGEGCEWFEDCCTGQAGSSAASTADGCDSDDAFYAAAEAKGTKYTWETALRGHFYKAEPKRVQGGPVRMSLLPVKLISRQAFHAEHMALSNRTRVVQVSDPCHPCMRNNVRPAIMPPGKHYMLQAAKDLPEGCLLGLYWGKLLTQQEDDALICADLTYTYGNDHSYNMTVDVGMSDYHEGRECEVVIVGDSKRCRLCLINDVASWADDMEAAGWGPCPRVAIGDCNCDM